MGYLATLVQPPGRHRRSRSCGSAPSQAVVRGAVVRDGRETMVELEITPGRANRARLNRSPLSRPRDVLGTLRTVLFAPEDLALVKGDPGERRRFLDELLVARQPRWSGVRSDYDKILKQRSALLKSAAPVLQARRPPRRATGIRGRDVVAERESALHTLDVWDSHLARSARSCSTPGCGCCATSARTSARPTTR